MRIDIERKKWGNTFFAMEYKYMVHAMVATAMATPIQTNHSGPIRTPTRKIETAISKDNGIVTRTNIEPAQLKGCLLLKPEFVKPLLLVGSFVAGWCNDVIAIWDTGVIFQFSFFFL